jgi:hypothetical protein
LNPFGIARNAHLFDGFTQETTQRLRPSAGVLGDPMLAGRGRTGYTSSDGCFAEGEKPGFMPDLSRFFGIIIRMFFNDHHPAHFHAIYQEHEALIAIESLDVLRGDLPRRALALVLEWAVLHREELRRDWQLAQNGLVPEPIAPLD